MTYDLKALRDLEKRLAEAKGPDCEIDALIWAELDGRDVRDDVERKMLLAKSRKPPHDECVLGWYDPGKTSRNFSPLNDHHHGRFTASLDAAVALVERVMPGWFWTAGKCKLNAHATVGPDRDGPHAHLLKDPTFDNGFDADMEHGIPALALCLACVRALIAQEEAA